MSNLLVKLCNIGKPKSNKQILVNFSIQNISTGQIGSYIINELYEYEGFRFIGYDVEKEKNGDVRCILYTHSGATGRVVSYFNDRCAGLIEEQVKKQESIAHNFKKWEDGFEYVSQ